jgi:hypothetical protein
MQYFLIFRMILAFYTGAIFSFVPSFAFSFVFSFFSIHSPESLYA